MTSFVVCTPSRGLVHSRTIEAVVGNVAEAVAAGHEYRGWVLSHDLPIPDCHERVTEMGMATGADYLWYVEEDVIPPSGALLASLELGADIAAMDYPMGEHPCYGCLPPTDPPYMCGLGCTLISRRVFEALPQPWFVVDGEWISLYGGQDISFCRHAIQAGFTISRVPGIAGHALLRSWGRFLAQDGRHTIDIRNKIERLRE